MLRRLSNRDIPKCACPTSSTSFATWQLTHPVLVDHKLPDDDPRLSCKRQSPTWKTTGHGWITPEYRRQGLPVSSSLVESLIKEMNFRVKGTEKFWNRPEGAENILQIRAAALRRRPAKPLDHQPARFVLLSIAHPKGASLGHARVKSNHLMHSDWPFDPEPPSCIYRAPW